MERTRSRQDLARDLVKALRKLKTLSPGDAARTEALREVARLSVDLREHFLTPSGEPDWAARTWEYRHFIVDRYSDADYSQEESRATQAAVRYHVSKYVRERLSPQEVADLGLRSESSVDRSREQRDARRALLNAARHQVAPGSEGGPGSADVLRAIAGALLVLQHIDPAALAEMTETDRVQAQAVLSRLVSRAEQLGDAAAVAGADAGE
ncbi:hypothetical protein [Micromonospora sp. NPDC047730]|uniref:hypothetical protein n=1 Tax=Micromonospora sp. NPDC047730 TaxID=3364253 RepID=UPI0037203861